MKKTFVLMIFVLVLSACGVPDTIPLPLTATPDINSPGMAVTMVPNEDVTPQGIATGEADEEYGDVNCTHTFYPVADGATWMYTISGGGNAIHTMSVDAFGDFIINVESAEMTAVIEGQCTPEGIIIMDAPGATTTVTNEDGSATVSAVNVSGVSLPQEIDQGQQWSQVVETTTPMGTSTIETTYTAVGFENITVPAGDFYALKIEQNGSVTILGQKVAMHGFQWLVEGVGVVKSAWDGAPTVELTMYDIPD